MLQKNAVINCKTNEVEYIEVEVEDVALPMDAPPEPEPEPTLEERMDRLEPTVSSIVETLAEIVGV